MKIIFQLDQGEWETFVERLELHFMAIDIEDVKKKKAVLFAKVNVEAYTLIRNLCASELPKDKSYSSLVKLVKDHLSPKPSEAIERCKFHQATQSANETVADFTAKLKNSCIATL